VVICTTGQAGTVIWATATDLGIRLRNGDLWAGPSSQCRYPQSREELDAAPKNVDTKPRRTKR
jgi:hypothetical protein